MNGPLEWIAAIGTMLAAGLIAADLGRKVTGWGFVLFCAVSVTWIVADEKVFSRYTRPMKQKPITNSARPMLTTPSET